jgi:hypothetical protein
MEFCAVCFGFRLLLTFIHSVTGRIPVRFPCSRVEYFQLRQLNYNILNNLVPEQMELDKFYSLAGCLTPWYSHDEPLESYE